MSITTTAAGRVLTYAEVSERTRLPISTLRHMRLQGRGPRTFRLGRRVVALEADVDSWIEAQRAAGIGDA